MNSQNNPDLDINLYNIAISNKLMKEKMYIRRYRAGDHNKILGAPELRDTEEFFEPEHIQSIICFSLDEIIRLLKLPIPKYLKIDVDGAERDILKGGEKTLSGGAVKEIFIELNESSSNGEYEKTRFLLEDYGFKETSRYPVKHMRGGIYPGLYNIIFKYKED